MFCMSQLEAPTRRLQVRQQKKPLWGSTPGKLAYHNTDREDETEADWETNNRTYENNEEYKDGEIEGANIIKLHRFSGKISYLAYPDFDTAPVGEAVDTRRLGGEFVHRPLERHDAALTDPIAEQVGGEAGVTQLRHVRPGIGQAQQDVVTR